MLRRPTRQPRRAVACAAAAAVVGASLLAGCSATDKGDKEPVGFRPLLSKSEVDRMPAGSPTKTVMELWRYAQLGSTPNIVSAYHPRVQTLVGRSNIASAYSIKRPYFLQAKPKPLPGERSPQGVLVRVIVTSDQRNGEKVPAAQRLPETEESFLLRRVGGTWRVIHDTVLERGLAEYILSQDPVDDQGQHSRAALTRARSASRTYRELFLPQIG